MRGDSYREKLYTPEAETRRALVRLYEGNFHRREGDAYQYERVQLISNVSRRLFGQPIAIADPDYRAYSHEAILTSRDRTLRAHGEHCTALSTMVGLTKMTCHFRFVATR